MRGGAGEVGRGSRGVEVDVDVEVGFLGEGAGGVMGGWYEISRLHCTFVWALCERAMVDGTSGAFIHRTNYYAVSDKHQRAMSKQSSAKPAKLANSLVARNHHMWYPLLITSLQYHLRHFHHAPRTS